MTKLGKHTENKERIGQARRDWTRVKKELDKGGKNWTREERIEQG